MSVEARITGDVDKLDNIARTLKNLDDKELNRELFKGLNRATKELRDDAKREAGQRLPRRGGLAAKVAKSRLSTRRRGGRNPGVSIVAKGLSQLRRMDEGQVKHPVFGNRDVWVTQEVSGGWFSDPMQAGRDDVLRRLDDALDDVAKQVARKYD